MAPLTHPFALAGAMTIGPIASAKDVHTMNCELQLNLDAWNKALAANCVPSAAVLLFKQRHYRVSLCHRSCQKATR
jgi:hypothetical protein